MSDLKFIIKKQHDFNCDRTLCIATLKGELADKNERIAELENMLKQARAITKEQTGVITRLANENTGLWSQLDRCKRFFGLGRDLEKRRGEMRVFQEELIEMLGEDDE